MAQINVYGLPDATSRTCVRYQRDRDVQIGIQPEVPNPDAESRWDEMSGLWGELDRKGCNDLIRALREARDKAYGRDE